MSNFKVDRQLWKMENHKLSNKAEQWRKDGHWVHQVQSWDSSTGYLMIKGTIGKEKALQNFGNSFNTLLMFKGGLQGVYRDLCVQGFSDYRDCR